MGAERVAIIAVENPTARGQHLTGGSPVGGHEFQPVSLDPGSVPETTYFDLQTIDGSDITAEPGEEVHFTLRLGKRGRDLRVRVPISK
jgi:hypothetical protein